MKDTAPIDVNLLTIRDLMHLTRESESAWRKRLGRREMPYIRLGSNIRVRREDLERWLAERIIPRQERAS
jgi:excisionase family DNA binding protein